MTVHNLTALATLVFLEIILSIDNAIFISIVVNRLPQNLKKKTWRAGLAAALLLRLCLLMMMSWVLRLNTPFVAAFEITFSIRDLILVGGGLFLIYKSTIEIHHGVAYDRDVFDLNSRPGKRLNSQTAAVFQIVFIDFIFSFDSVLTSVGVSNLFFIMAVAISISICVMMTFLKPITNFVKTNPSVEILALGFLILIGFVLLLDGFHYEIPKGYMYFTVAFSFSIEFLNIRKKNRAHDNKSIAAEKSTAKSSSISVVGSMVEPQGT